MNADSDVGPDDERGSEVDDYTGEVPVVEHRDPDTHQEGPQPSGFGDGDVADVDDSEFGLPSDMFDLDAVIAERDQYKDIMMRVQADFENYRKRTAHQVQDDVDRATGRLAEAFLPVLDAAEAAYLRHPDEVGPLLNVMLTELKKHGLETLDLEAQPFDPQVAEAVAHEPGDSGEVMITEVMRSGYRWRGKTLRPAMVRTKD
ncbi:MAG TPA: nucleotide exchange factor GrpE [Ilumatobacter sp.]|nr:nucleotide exchange factor GrpE [Ilumatobacter sp.]